MHALHDLEAIDQLTCPQEGGQILADVGPLGQRAQHPGEVRPELAQPGFVRQDVQIDFGLEHTRRPKNRFGDQRGVRVLGAHLVLKQVFHERVPKDFGHQWPGVLVDGSERVNLPVRPPQPQRFRLEPTARTDRRQPAGVAL